MALLISRIFGNEVEVFTTDDEGSMHFCRDDGTSEDTPANRDQAGEGTFLVLDLTVSILKYDVEYSSTNIGSFNRSLRCSEP